jgi:hypothetical protein
MDGWRNVERRGEDKGMKRGSGRRVFRKICENKKMPKKNY